MGSGPIGTQRNNAEGVPHEDGRLVMQREQPAGIPDDRRAELDRLQGEIGPAKDAASGGDPDNAAAGMTSGGASAGGEAVPTPAGNPDPADPAKQNPKGFRAGLNGPA